jgi:hypothetical protein
MRRKYVTLQSVYPIARPGFEKDTSRNKSLEGYRCSNLLDNNLDYEFESIWKESVVAYFNGVL